MAEHGQDSGRGAAPTTKPAQTNRTQPQPAADARSNEGGTAAHAPLALPVLNLVNIKLGLGRMNSDQFVQAITLNIGVPNQVAEITYDQINQISLTVPPLTKHQFLRVWKTILLYGVQNIQVDRSCRRRVACCQYHHTVTKAIF